jgi:integrase
MSSRGNGVKMLVAGLYKYLPPLRGQDYFNVILSRLPKNILYEQHYKKLNKNFIDMDNWVLVIGNYKTASKHGIRVIRFTGVLVDIVKKWIKIAGIGDGDWFLVNRMGKKFRQDAFTKMLWRIYGDNFSVDMLRRIYISEMVSYLEDLDNPVETIKWRKRLAFMVGHSLESQEFIYSNFKRMKRKKSSKKYMDEIFEYLKAAYVGE